MIKKLRSLACLSLLPSLVAVAVTLEPLTALADEAGTPPTAFRSKDWRTVAEVFPPLSRQNSSDKPICYLYSVAAPGDGWQAIATLLWKSELENPIMPEAVLVLPDERVITINDINHRGFENALVLYDRKGKLVRSLPLAELIPKEEMSRVRHTENSREWNEGARYFVTPSPPRLYVLLKWRGIIKVDITNGKVDYGDVAKFPEAITFTGKSNSPEQVEVLPMSLRLASITDLHSARGELKKQPLNAAPVAEH